MTKADFWQLLQLNPGRSYIHFFATVLEIYLIINVSAFRYFCSCEAAFVLIVRVNAAKLITFLKSIV